MMRKSSLIQLAITGLLVLSALFAHAQTTAEKLEKARTAAKAFQFNEAVKLYAEVLQADSTNPKIYVELAQVLANSPGGMQYAMASANKALSLDSNNVEALSFRAALYGQFYSKLAAIAEYDRLIQLQPNNTDHFFNRGNLLYSRGEYAKARADFDRVISQKPDDAEVMVLRGLCFMAEDKLLPARTDLERAIQLDPKNSEAYVHLGNARLLLKDVEGAEAAFQQSLATQRENPAAYFALAGLRYDAMRYTDARALCDSVLKYNAISGNAYALRAQCSLQMKEYDVTINDATRALELNPTAEMYTNRANAYYNLKRYQESLPDLNSALQLDGLYGPAYLLRALTHLQLNLPNIACSDLNKAKELGLQQAEGLIKRYCAAPAPATTTTPQPPKKGK